MTHRILLLRSAVPIGVFILSYLAISTRHKEPVITQPATPAKSGIQKFSIPSRTAEESAALWEEVRNGPSEPPSTAPNVWTCIGPAGIGDTRTAVGRYSGRILDVEIGQNVVRFASASGGLWENTLLGPLPLSDSVRTLMIGSFATDPRDPNTIIIGTGEGRISPANGLLLYKTTNHGLSWYGLGSGPQVGGTYRLRYDSLNPLNVYAATTNGLYTSTNGGEDWSMAVWGAFTDLAFSKSGNSREVYSCAKNGGIVRGGLYKSVNGGAWNYLITPVRDSLFGRAALTAVFDPGTQQTRIYFSVADPFNDKKLIGVFRSNDAGSSWTDVTPSNRVGTEQLDYNHVIAACPTNPDIVIVGWVKDYRTSDGGANWTMVDQLGSENHDRTHDDWHAFTWSKDGSAVYAGNDGGLSYSIDRGVTWNSSSNNFPITQFYSVSAGHYYGDDGQVIFGGTQDNGIVRTTDGGASWNLVRGGDGGDVAVSHSEIFAMFGPTPSPWVSRARSYDYGKTWTDIGGGIGPGGIIRRMLGGVMTHSGPYLYYSADGGANWFKYNTTPFPKDVSEFAAPIFSNHSPIDGIVYIVLSDTAPHPRLLVPETGAFAERSAGLPGNVTIRKVVPYPEADKKIVYALMNANTGPRIFASTSEGRQWRNITGNLPGVYVVDLLPIFELDSVLYIGTDMGIYKTTNYGTNWIRWSNGLPYGVAINQLTAVDSVYRFAQYYGKFEIIASTWGRSVWRRRIDDSVSLKRIEVTNTVDTGAGSLRKAILDANIDKSLDVITFKIPGAGVHTITPLSPLPIITGRTVIEGYSQPGSVPNSYSSGEGTNASIQIEINGTNTGGAVGQGALVVTASDCVIRGLCINRAPGCGILLRGIANNVVEGCFIGTDPLGTTALPNAQSGIRIEGESSDRIGGTAPEARNLISGNTLSGIGLGEDSRGGSNVVIENNLIGTNAAGNAAVPNQTGIQLGFIASYNRIGGSSRLERNIISGNSANGISIGGGLGSPDVSHNEVKGNYIGTDVTGSNPIPNGGGGVIVSGQNNFIGGTTQGDGNIISGNRGNGVTITSADGSFIKGNTIGLNGASAPLGNGGYGVRVVAHYINIGGIEKGAGNIIAYNGANSNIGGGVIIEGSGTSNKIETNSIYSNTSTRSFPGRGLGIDLGADGVTANDSCDGDIGPNNMQNYPVLSAGWITAESTIVVGSLNGSASITYRIEFFANADRDSTGFGEGQSYLGWIVVTTGSDCRASFRAAFGAPSTGNWITATAVDPLGNTSEFSRAIAIGVTDVFSQGKMLPQTFGLGQNYPNPFNPLTRIEYQLPVAEFVTLKIYNILGEETAVIFTGYENAGFKSVNFSAVNLSSGIYFYRLQAGTFSSVRKMLLVR